MKIINVGWYLLSTLGGASLRSMLQGWYGHPTYLDISLAYVPLFFDISSQITASSDFHLI